MLLWTVVAMTAARIAEGWRSATGGVLAAFGAGLLTMRLLVPDRADVLRALDRTLNIAPATETSIFA